MKKNLLKKLMAIVMMASLMLTGAQPFFACEAHNNSNIRFKKGGYEFYANETIGKGKEIIRVYDKNSNKFTKPETAKETRNMLLALGANSDYVNELSDKELKEYAEASTVMVSVSYSKVDEDGNITYLDEETALAEASIAQAEQEALIANQQSGIATASSTSDTSRDSYMKITYQVRGSGENFYTTVIAEWLTMPVMRGYDSIGACAKYITVTSGTPKCKISYVQTTTNTGKTTSKTITKNITNIKKASKNGWSGVAAIFDLPNDSASTNLTIAHSKFKATFTYTGKIELPSQKLNFNASASYVHSTIALQVAPSVSIGVSGSGSSADATIGLSIAGAKDVRSVWLELQYVP